MPPKNNVNPELDNVVAEPVNRTCADCSAKAPRWASVNLGVLVCIDCSGAHRNLGTHISVVKSVTLDKWQPKWIATVSKIGNQSANGYYEHRLDMGEKPREGDSLEKKAHFIRKKYEQKHFIPRNKPSPSELLAQGRDPHVYCDDGGGRDRSPSVDRRASDREDRRPRPRTPSPQERPRRDNGAGPTRVGAGREPAKAPEKVVPLPLAPAPAAAPTKPPANSVDLLGGLETPAVAAVSTTGVQDWAQFGQPPAPAAQPTPEYFNPAQCMPSAVATPLAVDMGSLPDVFAAPQATPAPVVHQEPHQQAEQLQDQKVDYMKSALASLYQQPLENRYAAFTSPMSSMGMAGNCVGVAGSQSCAAYCTPAGNMGMAVGNYAYAGAMVGYNGCPANPTAHQLPAVGQMPNPAMSYMGAVMQSMPVQQFQYQMAGAMTSQYAAGYATGHASAAYMLQQPVTNGVAGHASGLTLPCGAGAVAKTGESDHAEAMRQVMDSLSQGVAGGALQSPTVAQVSSLDAVTSSLTEIDAFSAFSRAPPQGLPQTNGASLATGMQQVMGASPATMLGMQQMPMGSMLGPAQGAPSMQMAGGQIFPW